MSTTKRKICCPHCGSTEIEIPIKAWAIVDVSVVDPYEDMEKELQDKTKYFICEAEVYNNNWWHCRECDYAEDAKTFQQEVNNG